MSGLHQSLGNVIGGNGRLAVYLAAGLVGGTIIVKGASKFSKKSIQDNLSEIHENLEKELESIPKKSVTLEDLQKGALPGGSNLEEFKKDPKSFLKKYLEKLVSMVQSKTGLPRNMAVLVTGGCVLAVLSGIKNDPVVYLAGYVYPLYASFKAIKSEGLEDDKQWLTYWVVFGTFSVVETFTGNVFSWFPMYQVFKTVFLTWCFLPQTQGARFIFEKFVDPFLSKYEDEIDSKLEKIQETVSKARTAIE